jgi:hypothetical protein
MTLFIIPKPPMDVNGNNEAADSNLDDLASETPIVLGIGLVEHFPG